MPETLFAVIVFIPTNEKTNTKQRVVKQVWEYSEKVPSFQF